MTRIFDKKLIKFLAVGVCNTLLSAAIMFLLYNLLQFGYWGSSAVAYIAGGIFSFFANRKFTFQYKGSAWKAAVRFAACLAICYLIAYGMAKPLVEWLLLGFEKQISDQISMVVGMAFYTILNYLLQRFFAFRQKDERSA